ncbi:GCN5-related N-acetyltransferase [Pseudopedobacter saltans DSM 12145]|uniref:GCN5-related N-acetyltransferase n=1 Tax=Pseudopedobacter saltans (strain ATCC 51119 / DSM 12145 / JCM 21818 / CCUG 39354 / LMG 10337 / NBRC 100064 / NCIMB 13643) TaxID=762903 RepID=F0S6M7_PSESL|nr:GNAT family N-acetyltransferase [Pseudopedobacter saltans]ADY51103.1 GCN5-related N-acetyltransferase [Pseudopedobacter saltans DSM 12145]
MDFNIRAYEQKDREPLLKILKQNVPLHFAELEVADFNNYLDEYVECYFVVESGITLIGAGGINLDKENNNAKISWDFISPDYQGKGIGSKLLKYRINIIQSMPDIKQIIVRTSQTAYQFYQKNGFVLEKVEKNYWADGFDLYYMTYFNSLVIRK